MLRRFLQIAADVLFVVFLAVLLRLTVFRSGCFGHPLFQGAVHLDPVSTLRHYVRVGAWYTFRNEFIGNLVCMAPLGLYLSWRRWRFLSAVAAAFALTVTIETLQFVLGSGVAETSDVILNTAGAALGWCVWSALRALTRPPQR